MRVLLGALADREDVDTGLSQFDRRSQPGPPVPITSTMVEDVVR
jgi:hypothetical protein